MSRHRPLHGPRRRRHPDDATARFEGFVAEAGDSLFRLAVLLSMDVQGGEDLYQETLQRVASHWAVIENPGAWSRRVMRNLAVDRFRASRSRPAEVAAADHGSAPDPRSADPLEAIEVRQALFRALGDLSEVQRLVVALRFLEDRSEADVAELLSVPVGTVKSTASRAIARLRRHSALMRLFPHDEATG